MISKQCIFLYILTKPQGQSPPWSQILFPYLAAPGCEKKTTFSNLLVTKKVCLSGLNFYDLVEIFSDFKIKLSAQYLPSVKFYDSFDGWIVCRWFPPHSFLLFFYSVLTTFSTPILHTSQFHLSKRSESAGDSLWLVSCVCIKQIKWKLRKSITGK